MAYRKTEKVLANSEARRSSIIASAIDVISKSGMDGFSTAAVATRAGVSIGLIYNHFPDKTELLAAAVAQLLSRDLAAIRAAGGIEKGIRAWAKQVAANYRLMSAMGATPIYRAGIRAEFAKMLRATDAESPAILSAVVYGAVLEAAGTLRPRDEQTLVGCLLKAVGVRARAEARG